MAVSYPPESSIDVSTTAASLYTVPDTAGILLRDATIKITNYTAATRLVNVYGVPSGGVASQANADAYQASVPPYDSILVAIRRLGQSGKIQVSADNAAALNAALISGNLYTP
jgi:hypothetical protein